MNILLLVNSFWNNGKGMSGGDQMLIQTFKRISPRFEHVRCFTSFDGQRAISRDVHGIEFIRTSRVFDRLHLSLNYLFRMFAAFSIIRLKGIDTIFSSSDFFPDVVPAFLYKLVYPKVKWCQAVYHVYPDYKVRPGNKARNFLAQYAQKVSFLLARRADLTMMINTEVRDYLASRGFQRDKMVVNPPGIDLERIAGVRVSEDTPAYEATFLGRLNPSKGIFDLVRVWRKVVEKKRDSTLAVIGNGDERTLDSLKREIAENGLTGNVFLLGFLDSEKSYAIIKKSKVFLFPSHEEGFGIAIAEAMACGVPVVAWDLKVYREVFKEHVQNCPLGDIEEMAKKVIEHCEGRRSTEEARSFVKKYNWDIIAEKAFNYFSNKPRS